MEQLPYREPPQRSGAPPPEDDAYLVAWRRLTRLRRYGYLLGAVLAPTLAAFMWLAVASPGTALRWLPFLFVGIVVPGVPFSVASVRFRCPHCRSLFHEKASANRSACDSCGIEIGTPRHVAMLGGVTKKVRAERHHGLAESGPWMVAVVLVMAALAATGFSLVP